MTTVDAGHPDFVEYPLEHVHRLIEPGPVIMVSTFDGRRANLMTNGFNMPVAHGALIGLILGPWDHSYDALRTTGECVIAIPSIDLAERVVDVGNVSGRDVDKWQRFGFTPAPGAVVRAPLVTECFANIECTVADDRLVDDHNLWILKGERAWIDPGRRGTGEFHHCGNGTFAGNATTLDLRHRMTKWRYRLTTDTDRMRRPYRPRHPLLGSRPLGTSRHPPRSRRKPTMTTILDELRRRAADPGRRILLTGAAVVTMDPGLGVMPRADLLIEGDRIAAVGPDLQAEDALIIDVTGAVLAPGFVDTHRHAWEAQLRRIMPDVNDLGEYVTSTLAGIAPAYQPQDMYIGTKLAALTAIDSGITTMLDFSHNSRTAAHSDAAIRALIDSGIRGVHASMRPHFGDWDGQWPADLTRLQDTYFTSSSGLLTLRLATLATGEIAGPDLAYGERLARTARDLGIGVSIDAVFGLPSSEAILDWVKQGLLGPDVALIHCTGLTSQAWQAMADTGAAVSLAPTSDAQIGLESAVPAVDEALAVGIRPSLSIDVEVALAGDMFTQMRALHAIQRMRAVNAAYGTGESPTRIGVHDVLDFATLQGARSIGLGDVTGSLTPGKQADVLVVRAEDLNNMPLNDPIGTLVLGSDPRNIDAVLIAGQVRKWAGTVLDIDLAGLREDVRASRDRVLAAAGYRHTRS